MLPEGLLIELHEAYEHYLYLNDRIAAQDRKIKQQVAQDERCQLLKTVPGIGDMVASQTVAEIGNGHQFRHGREMAAWLGLVPRQYSTGGRIRLMGISKRGNKRLRSLFVHGARSILSLVDRGGGPFNAWLKKLLETKPFNVVCIALANRLVRIAWAVVSKMEPFDGSKLQVSLQ